MSAEARDRTDHLDDAELIDAVDRTLPPARRLHLEACAECRAAVDGLVDTLRDVPDADVPEPAAEFWDHLSAGVRDLTALEPPPGWRPARPAARLGWVALAAAATILLAAAAWYSGGRGGGPAVYRPAQLATAVPAGAPHVEESFEDVELDEAWGIIRTVADDLPADIVAGEGGSLRPTAVEDLVLRLSDGERRELARLLEEAIRDAGAGESSS
jgi:hypothetical protein